MSEPISAAFAAIIRLAERRGVTNIKHLPGCWEVQVDQRWWFALNGHGDTMKADGAEVPPYHAYVTYNEWPAGLFSPYGGTFAAGDGANEETFIAAVDACP